MAGRICGRVSSSAGARRRRPSLSLLHLCQMLQLAVPSSSSSLSSALSCRCCGFGKKSLVRAGSGRIVASPRDGHTNTTRPPRPSRPPRITGHRPTSPRSVGSQGLLKKTSYRRVSGASGRCGWSGGPGRNRGRYTRDECKKRITVKLWHNFLILS